MFVATISLVTQFHTLTIKDIRKETADCVSIAFDVPEALSEKFRFQAGQNITIKININGEELRRSYSICSSPFENELRVAVKNIGAGRFSAHANRQLKVGDTIQVLPPGGRFSAGADKNKANRYLAFAAGSGITPVISLIKTILLTEPQSQVTLVYGNRNRNSIIFREQLEGIKNRFIDRFALHHILSREKTEAAVNHGRINADKCEELSKGLIDAVTMDHIFLCGPEEMIFSTRNWLMSKNVPAEKIHFELFNVPGQKVHEATEKQTVPSGKVCKVTIKLDGAMISFDHPFEGQSLLDGALQQGADLPFACKGGVCATCKAKLVQGEVSMDNNYALEADELKEGFVLTCQSHPLTNEVVLDFDRK